MQRGWNRGRIGPSWVADSSEDHKMAKDFRSVLADLGPAIRENIDEIGYVYSGSSPCSFSEKYVGSIVKHFEKNIICRWFVFSNRMHNFRSFFSFFPVFATAIWHFAFWLDWLLAAGLPCPMAHFVLANTWPTQTPHPEEIRDHQISCLHPSWTSPYFLKKVFYG